MQAILGLLAAILGFALVVQVRTTQASTSFSTARQDDLVRILDDLTARSERLQQEIDEQQAARDRLANAGDRDAAAVAEAQKRADTLAVIAGTVAARGSGVRVVIDDPAHALTADVLLDTIQELRDAGTEAMMINGHRIGATSYVIDRDGAIVLDGSALSQPYTITAIGNAATLDEALSIPRGIVQTVEDEGARITVTRATEVLVDALRPLSTPRYARPTRGD